MTNDILIAMDAATPTRFALGTFRDDRGDVFAGLVIGEEVLALPAGTSIRGLLEDWDRSLPELQRLADRRAPGAARHRLAELAGRPPVMPVGQIFQAGANYRRHVRDLFDAAQRRDWELELVAVIGRPARRVAREHALEHVAGYMIANDLTLRDRLHRADVPGGLDWLAAKNPPTFLPRGPLLVPAAHLGDPMGLRIVPRRAGLGRIERQVEIGRRVAAIAVQRRNQRGGLWRGAKSRLRRHPVQVDQRMRVTPCRQPTPEEMQQRIVVRRQLGHRGPVEHRVEIRRQRRPAIHRERRVAHHRGQVGRPVAQRRAIHRLVDETRAQQSVDMLQQAAHRRSGGCCSSAIQPSMSGLVAAFGARPSAAPERR